MSKLPRSKPLLAAAAVTLLTAAGTAYATGGPSAPAPAAEQRPAAAVAAAAPATAAPAPAAPSATAPADAAPVAVPSERALPARAVFAARVPVGDTGLDANGVNVRGRPQLRLAMTDAQTQTYWNNYNRCLVEHGVPDLAERGLSPMQDGRSAEAEAACADELPRMPIASDPDRNPRYERDFAAWVACMNERGLPVVATATGPTAGGWTYGTARTARERRILSPAGWDEARAIERGCELAAFIADDRP